MATIDIRATVTCSLGELISGSVSDDYIQGSGLVKTKGSCDLVGVLTPAVGSLVTFSYARDGVNVKVPRALRVLSSFADPIRKVTKVELGCKLAYMENVTPAPTVDDNAPVTSGRQQQCLNGYIEYPANSVVPIPVSAAGVMNTCLAKIGVTASSNPLTNYFNADTFDLSAGYVGVLSDLLESEGYFGYLDDNEVLQVRDLGSEGGSGAVITPNDVIDLDAIGVGDLPGEAVVVRYNSMKLNTAIDTSDSKAEAQSNWEEEEVVGRPTTVPVRYSVKGVAATRYYGFIPVAKTVTTYGKDDSWDETTCVIASSSAEGADLSNSVIRRVTTQNTILAEAANSYCAQVLSAGGGISGNRPGEIRTVEEYSYNDKGQQVRLIRSTYEPFFKWAGGLGIDFAYPTSRGTSYVQLGSLPVLVEQVIVDSEYIGEPQDQGEKQTTTTYQNWALTLGGQQGGSSIKEFAPFTSAGAALSWLEAVCTQMVQVDCQVRTNRGRGGSTSGQVRGAKALRLGGGNGASTESTAQLAYVMGSASSDRFVSFSMPYQSDDTYRADGAIQPGGAEAKALRYGRIQNRLLLGNRNGVNLQLHASKMAVAPFDPLYLSDGSLMVQYRANAINWAFSSDGIVASVDALFWGVAGGAGTSWVPVAPGVTTFPPLPAVVNGTTNVPALVPPWNEQVPFEGVTRTTAVVDDYPYLIGSFGVEAIELTTRTIYSVGSVLSVDAGTFNVAGQAASGGQVRGLAGDVGSFVVNGAGAGNVRTYGIGANAGTFTLAGAAAALRYQRQALVLAAGSFVVSGQSAGSFRGVSMAAAAGTFAIARQAATLKSVRLLAAGATNYGVGGQAAGLSYITPQMATVLYTGSGVTRSISGLSIQPGLVWIKRRTVSAENHWLFDHVRGATKVWHPNLINMESVASTSLTAFNVDGFTLGNQAAVNTNAALYVAWCWAKGGTATLNTSGTTQTTCSVNSNLGMSIFTYTGGAGAQTMGHGLGQVPDLIIVKRLDGNAAAFVGSPLIGTGKYLVLNSTAAAPTVNSGVFTSITSTVFGGNSVSGFSISGQSLVGYAFASKAGMSKIGTFTGTGASTQAVTGLGFSPRWVLVKSISSATSAWQVFDTSRDAILFANDAAVEATPKRIVFGADGFTLDSAAGVNSNGADYLYMAFA